MSATVPDPKSKPAGSNGSETVAFVSDQFSKEERDVAFAMKVMAAGLITERQLQTALVNWTIYGDTALADLLQGLTLVSREDRERCESAAAATLAEVHNGQASANSGGKSTLTSTLQSLDVGGRVAKLLGILDAVAAAQGELRSAVTRLTLIRKLGQGGLGTVWLARDEEMQRHVALKEISRTNDGSGHALARFRREAEITGRLEHPGIVPVYEFGEDRETQRVFYTMRFLGKQTLQDSIHEYHERREAGDHDPMLLRNLLTAFVSVCQAIGHAHSRKVIHRDLKPENVAIDNFGQVIVIDWGLAKVVEETGLPEHLHDLKAGADTDSQQTVAGQVLGTPLYMAPEQAAGRLDEVDERTDVYGLGAILFAILTGAAPHERSQQSSSSSGARGLITAIASKPTPLAREINAKVDPALESICAKAMAKRRYARYQSPCELAGEIQRWMAGEPVEAYRERRSQRLGRWIHQHRRTSQAIATGLIVALVAVVVTGTITYQEHIAARRARFENLKGEAREIDAQFAAHIDHLTKIVRLVSSMPSLLGVISAHDAIGNATAESEKVWRPRLEQTYEGCIRVNRDYLSITLMAFKNDSLQEIARVERQAADPTIIRGVPKSRLAEHKSNAFLDTVRTLNPGDVRLKVVEPETNGVSQSRSRPKIIGATPVFSEATGEIFGIVVVESDVLVVADSILDNHNGGQEEIFVTDGHGQIWTQSRTGRGVSSDAVNSNITANAPVTAEFFSPSNAESSLVIPDSGIIAHRVRLNSFDAATTIGVVLRLVE